MIETKISFPDEYIAYWAEIYLGNPLLQLRGVRFDVFLIAPDEILWAVLELKRIEVEFLPLLPAQRKVQQRQAWVERANARSEPVLTRLAKHVHACLHKSEKEPSCLQQH